MEFKIFLYNGERSEYKILKQCCPQANPCSPNKFSDVFFGNLSTTCVKSAIFGLRRLIDGIIAKMIFFILVFNLPLSL